MVTGTAGTGKTSLAHFATAAHLVEAACQRGEAALYFSFEESPDQQSCCGTCDRLAWNPIMAQWVKKGLLHIHSTRPTTHGLEMHLIEMHNLLESHRPQVVVVDPISSLLSPSSQNKNDVKNMILRVIGTLKQLGDHGFPSRPHTALTSGSDVPLKATELDISSLVDTWLLPRDLESDGERNRVMYVLKSRGMAHSNQLREFLLTKEGVDLRPAYIGPGGVLTGSTQARSRPGSPGSGRRIQVEARNRASAERSDPQAARVRSRDPGARSRAGCGRARVESGDCGK